MKHILRFRAADKADFGAIRNNQKTVETRAATVKYRGIKAGDQLEIVCAGDRLTKTVVVVRHFDSIASLIDYYGIRPIAPLARDAAELGKMYHSYSGYEAKIREHGLMAFELK